MDKWARIIQRPGASLQPHSAARRSGRPLAAKIGLSNSLERLRRSSNGRFGVSRIFDAPFFPGPLQLRSRSRFRRATDATIAARRRMFSTASVHFFFARRAARLPQEEKEMLRPTVLRFVAASALAYTAAAIAQFTDITTASGVGKIIDDYYQTYPDWWLSGMHLVDLDGDGHLDLFLSSHANADAIALLNDGHGAFALAPGNWPTTEAHLMYDIDEDGKVDLSMTYADGGAEWWRNTSSAGTLAFGSTGITRDTNTARTQVLADFNRDGRVDWLRAAPPGISIDYGTVGGGFAADSFTISLPNTDSNNNANVIAADFDGDGKLDLLVMIGGGYDDTDGYTDFYRNTGPMQWSKQTAAAGLPANGLIVKGVGDFNLDGSLDLIAIENRSLPPVVYLNDGHGVFTKLANAISGVAAESLTYAQWGTAVTADFDNDGIPDILMNGKYYLMLLRGTGGGHFDYKNAAWGITDICPCSIDGGLAFGDIDGDGDLDIVGYANIDEPYKIQVYRNDNPARHWLRVRPIGLAGNRGAAGAKIRLFAPGTKQLVGYEQVMTYDFQAAPSYYGSAMTERHFGLGDRTSVDTEVEFYPSGRVVHATSVAANGVVEIREDADPIFANGFD